MNNKNDDSGKKRPLFAWLRSGGIVLLLVSVIVSWNYLDLATQLKSLLAWIDQLGWVGILMYALLYTVSCVFFIPGSLLTLGAGVIFGVAKGTVIALISATMGATAAFLVGRYLAGEWVAKWIEGKPMFRAMDSAIAEDGWKIVGLTRLSPVFPFNLLNYAYGLTRVSLKHYFWASLIGMAPGSLMYVYIGSLAGSLAMLGDESVERQRTDAEWAMYGLGLVATITVTVYITRMARRALAERMELKENGDE